MDRLGAYDLLIEMLEAGFQVWAEDGSVWVAPSSRLNDTLRSRIRAAKPNLLELLDPPRPAGPCADCGSLSFVRPAVGPWECLACTSLPPERIAMSLLGPESWAERSEEAA